MVEIPRRIHRIWLDDPMPDRLFQYGQQWRALHPDWTVTDWTDRNELPPLFNRDLFDRARQIYPQDWKRFEADLLRLELLWIYGGVYVDTDVEPLRPINLLTRLGTCVVGRSPQHVKGHHPVTNAVMMATPGHPFIATLIDNATEAVHRFGHRPLAQSVGPWHLTRTYEAGDWPDVTVLDHDDLYAGKHFRHHWANKKRKTRRPGWRF